MNTHDFLLNFLEANPCRDGDVFLAALTRENPEVARRVMEVRTAYASRDFEWSGHGVVGGDESTVDLYPVLVYNKTRV